MKLALTAKKTAAGSRKSLTCLRIAPPDDHALDLTEADRAMLGGDDGPVSASAKRILCAMAAQQGAQALVDVTQVGAGRLHLRQPRQPDLCRKDGGLRREGPRPDDDERDFRLRHRRAQGVPASFGNPAALLAEAGNLYVADTLNHIIRKISPFPPAP